MAKGIYERKWRVQHLVDNDTGCWNYCGKIQSNGYGNHRGYYKKYKGQIPTGLTLDHLCKNKRCVNPKHLEAVSAAENRQRAAKITRDTVDEIRLQYEQGIKQIVLSQQFGLNQGYISRIINKKRWAYANN